MNISDSQSLYMMLVLPSLFGMTLLTEGVWKVIHQNMVGFLNIFLGFAFISAVMVGFFLFKGWW